MLEQKETREMVRDLTVHHMICKIVPLSVSKESAMIVHAAYDMVKLTWPYKNLMAKEEECDWETAYSRILHLIITSYPCDSAFVKAAAEFKAWMEKGGIKYVLEGL